MVFFFVVLFYGAGRFVTYSSVVPASSVTPGCVSVFVWARRFGMDSTVKSLGVICFLLSVTAGRASVFELAQCCGMDSAVRFLSVVRSLFLRIRMTC